MFSCFPYKKSRRIRSADGPWKEVSDWDREISRDSLAGCGCWNRWKPPRPGVSKWSPSQWGSLSRSKNAEMFADQQCCTNSWWFQGFLLFLTLKLEKNGPFCGGVESTMQRFPKDVKCRSTFETGSNLAKDFKDTFWFFFRSSQHVSTRQQKWILDDLGTSSWNFGSRICGKKTGGGNPGRSSRKIPVAMSLDRCAVVIDVREQHEWDAGHVSCATRLQIQKILKLQGGTRRDVSHEI